MIDYDYYIWKICLLKTGKDSLFIPSPILGVKYIHDRSQTRF